MSYSPTTGAVTDTRLIPPSPADFSKYIAEVKFATSRDGTSVPLTIIRKRNMAFDGHPAWLTGYGAYAESQLPTFQPARLVWLEQGGILAIAHVRGGGELSSDWYKGGKGPQKINTIDDFIACAEFLVKEKYTRPDKLAAVGESAGGMNDIRVPPWQSGKFAARLQQINAHTGSNQPVLVRVDEYGGHDAASNSQFADIQSFLIWRTLHGNVNLSGKAQRQAEKN